MKIYFLLPSLLLLLFISACKKDDDISNPNNQQACEYYIPKYEALYKTRAELSDEIKSSSAKPIKNPGKIFLLGNYFFINEVNEGVHVIDNSNPSSPQNVQFINVPGCKDIAVRGGVLYADNYMDLVAINISSLFSASEIDRVENVFDTEYYYINDEDRFYLGQIFTGEYDTINCNTQPQGPCIGCNNTNPVLFIDAARGNDIAVTTGDIALTGATSESSAGSFDGVGQAGSMARFALIGEYLYALDDMSINFIDVSNPFAMSQLGETNVGWGIETIFPYQEKLFIGAMNGMHIYDISNPLAPNHISSYEHITSCDPVVVDENYAFVTLRSGNLCWGGVNELQVIDISDIYNPSLLKAYPMHNPHGLGLGNNNTLFLCDGDDGLKVFDRSDVETISDNLLEHYSNMNAYDVIPLQNTILMIGNDGFYQYNYSDLNNIYQISHIPVL